LADPPIRDRFWKRPDDRHTFVLADAVTKSRAKLRVIVRRPRGETRINAIFEIEHDDRRQRTPRRPP